MTSLITCDDVKKIKVSYNPFEKGLFIKAVPTTEAQKEIWSTLCMDANATLCYNESLVVDLEGSLSFEIFNEAFQELIKKHDVLRAHFSEDGKTFFVKEYVRRPIIILDHLDMAQLELEKLIKTEVHLKYDLVNGPCYRATLIKTNSESYKFLFSAHHIICDGWSFAILLNELSDIYNTLKRNQYYHDGESFQFAEYAIDEHKNGVDKKDRDYWLKEFRTPVCGNDLPLDFKRPQFRTFDSARYDLEVSSDLVKKLKKLGAGLGCSFYSTLMSTFGLLLHKISKSDEIVVGMASATQSGLGKSSLIGHLVNLLPLRVAIDNKMPFNLFLKSIRGKMLDAFEHQFYSYGSLVKDLKTIQRIPGQIPLLSVVFNIDQQSLDQGLHFDGIRASYTTTPRNFENFEIFINAVSAGDKLTLECQYNTNLFSASTILNWMTSFVELMTKVVSDPTMDISGFELEDLKIPSTSLNITTTEKSHYNRVVNPEVAEKVKCIWAQVLLHHPLALEDNFFSVGGHSILAIEVAELLKKEFKIDFTIRDIFENPTILDLAGKIENNNETFSENLPAIKGNGASLSRIGHNQMQVWYLEEMHKKTTMHNLPSAIRLKTKINWKVLQATLHLIVERHPALRTAIVVEQGEPVQKILDKTLERFRPDLNVVKTTEDKIVDLLNQEANYVFDKTEPPLFRAKLFELGESDYVFFFMVHHTIWDGWSFDIFFEELNAIYTSLLNKKPINLEKASDITHVDYSLWLHQLLNENLLTKQISYWEEKLKSPLPVLDLPLDYKRPLKMSHEGKTLPFVIAPETALALRLYAKKCGSSLFNVLLTAFKITLARYTGLQDIIVGLPVRGRTSTEIMQTIGYFVNTVALRSEINLNQSFEDNLKHVTQVALEAFENQLLPFQIVLNKVHYNRETSRTPIFQTFFSYQDVSNRSAQIDGTSYTQINIDKASTHTDLDLWIKSNEKKIEGAFEFRSDLFKVESIKRFKECFFTVLEDLIENSNRPLHLLRSIPENQENLILNDWNNTWTEEGQFIPFYKLFEAEAILNPHRVAIESTNERMTYGELDQMSTRFAHVLIEKGIGRGDLVGISLTRSKYLVAALLGVLKTGAGYVPLDPGFPQERLDYMLKNSNPKILLTEDSLSGRFKEIKNKILISSIGHEESFKKGLPLVDYAFDDTSYVIYTSGSTGNPKGVEVTHGSVANFLLSMQNLIGVDKDDKILAVTTLSFDIAVLELFLPLISGGSLFLTTSYEAMDGASLKNILNNNSISLLQATPSTWRLLLAAGWTGNKKIKALCGGEAFPIDLARTLIPKCADVWNMYGPTETTVWSACKKLTIDDEFVSVGRPIANTTLYILDENKKMLPIGATGELFIGGCGLAKGYWEREDLTREKFISDPFYRGKKMYATGDFARFTHDGEVLILGRNDGQVKIRGYRIEVGEIESELQKIPEVHEAAVLTSEYRPGDVRLFAYLVTINNKSIEEKILRDLLSKKLPTYMIPSHFTFMNEIPKTLNGKVDKRSLAKIQVILPTDELKTVEPVAESILDQHQKLRSMWCEILGINHLRNTDNFFDIGGNSLMAVELFSKILKAYKIKLPLASLVESENFEDFAKKIEMKISEDKGTGLVKAENHFLAGVPQIYKSLVAIKSTGHKNPLFCFHSVGGNVLNYVTLAPATKNERPLIALQSLGFDGVTPLLLTIEEMASHYVREIKMVQPEGPYLLAGGSMGGMLAIETAMQLKKIGDSIDKLIMFDTFGPKLDLKSYRKNCKSPLSKKIKEGLKSKAKMLLNVLQSGLYRSLGLPVPLSILLIEIERKNYKAIWKYCPNEVYAGDLHLIRSDRVDAEWYSDPVMGWEGIVGGDIKTFNISSSHENFIESPELLTVLKNIL